MVRYQGIGRVSRAFQAWESLAPIHSSPFLPNSKQDCSSQLCDWVELGDWLNRPTNDLWTNPAGIFNVNVRTNSTSLYSATVASHVAERHALKQCSRHQELEEKLSGFEPLGSQSWLFPQHTLASPD